MLREGIKLFTVRGIEIRLDYSWFVIFILVTWTLAEYYFPAKHEQWSVLTYWGLGVLTSILFFTSVLLHELSHSFVAQAFGTPVPRITLFIFGGAAQISEESKSAKAEFLMALAGPAMSVLIGIVCGGLWYLTREAIPPLAAVLGWLALINFMLAFFNMIPGFPLDGGRVLKAVIWAITGNELKSTQAATVTGKAVAYLFIFVGVYMAFQGIIFQGIWLVLIGWFLLQAATQTSKQQTLQYFLQGHTAGQAMWTDFTFVDAGTSLYELVHDKLLHTGRRCFPVMDNGQVTGIVTVHNVKSVDPQQWPHTSVRNIMIPAESLKSVSPETPLDEVMQMMSADGYNQVPVVRKNKFLGMITREALMDFMKTKSELGLRSEFQKA